MITGITIAIGVPHYILAVTKTGVVDIVSYIGLAKVNSAEIYSPSACRTHTSMNNRSYVYPAIKVSIDLKFEIASTIGGTVFRMMSELVALDFAGRSRSTPV